jgi:hypothetical protein
MARLAVGSSLVREKKFRWVVVQVAKTFCVATKANKVSMTRLLHPLPWVLAVSPIAMKMTGLLDSHWLWVLSPLLALLLTCLVVIVLWIREEA